VGWQQGVRGCQGIREGHEGQSYCTAPVGKAVRTSRACCRLGLRWTWQSQPICAVLRLTLMLRTDHLAAHALVFGADA
jgi:hypothetical protein